MKENFESGFKVCVYEKVLIFGYVQGLTEKFKEKDTQYTGSATLSYETFMTMVIPFLVAE